jgi:hypothetical protein
MGKNIFDVLTDPQAGPPTRKYLGIGLPILGAVLFILVLLGVTFSLGKFSMSRGQTPVNNNYSPTIYNYYNEAKKDEYLNLSAHLNLDSQIVIDFGKNFSKLSAEDLKQGFWEAVWTEPTTGKNQGLFFRNVNSQILVTTDIYSFDHKLYASIVDNKLVQGEKDRYHITDSTMEVFDVFGVPVLQIHIKSAKNAIVINGVFMSTSGYIVATDSGKMDWPVPMDANSLNFYKMTTKDLMPFEKYDLPEAPKNPKGRS